MKVCSQEAYNEGLKWYFELEKRLGLAKDDKDLFKKVDTKQEQ